MIQRKVRQGRQKTCMTGIQPYKEEEFIDKKQVSFHKKNSFRKVEGGGSQKAIWDLNLPPPVSH